MKKKHLQWLKLVSEIQAIAQSGLAFSTNEYDIDRYHRLMEISSEFAAHLSDSDLSNVKKIFSLEKGYATPKIDVRSYIMKDNKILLVKERADGLWTLPGGYADVNESPSDAVIRETKEESGFDVEIIRFVALLDNLKHEHPLQWPHVYKCFFHCNIISGEALSNLEISEVDFFEINALPPLSTPRITEYQLKRLYEHISQQNPETLFD